MRVLMIVPQIFYSTRGTPLSAYHRTRELIAQGHEVDIVTYKGGAAPPDLPVRVLRSWGPHFARTIPAGPSRAKIWFDFLLMVRLLARLCVRRYGMLYAHEEGAFLARVAGALFRTPYVYDMHSSLPLQITEWSFSSNRNVVRLFDTIERFCVDGAAAVVAISPAVARAASRASPDATVVTIVNKFELGAQPHAGAAARIRERHSIPADAPLVTYTGSFVKLQALDLLIEAAAIVGRRVENACFLLVGGTPQEIEPLRKQAERLGVADRIVFELARPQNEMPAYMAAADVLVSPRVRGINPPGKLIAYLASGRPVVATDTLVHNQVLEHDIAFLTQPTADGLAEGIVTALQDPARARGKVEAAARFVRSYCSETNRRDAYRRIFSAVEQRRGRAVAGL